MNQGPPIGFLLVEVSRLYRARIDCAFDRAGLGLTAGEARTLAYINLHPGLRQSAMAEKMNVEPMTLVVFLDRLENLGLIAREVDPTDRRAKIVRLTEAAGPHLERIMKAASRARSEALADYSTEEQSVLYDLLLRIRSNLTASKTP